MNRDTTNVPATAHWRLLVKHPSGSLEQAVNAARRGNLLVSSSILGILGISVGFLVVSTRRAQDLARQQLEFVATVSHELRTPLAVIRSCAKARRRSSSTTKRASASTASSCAAKAFA